MDYPKPTVKLNNEERYALNRILQSQYFHAIRMHYGGDFAKRSGIPLINHIIEGLCILIRIGAPRSVCGAWCFHPIIQSDEDLRKTLEQTTRLHNGEYSKINFAAILLAMEYRHVANSYLSQHVNVDLDIIKDQVNAIPGIREMLIADKIQNWKDFSSQPKGTYPNEMRLHEYFDEWCYRILDLGLAEVGELTSLITTGKGDDEE